MLLKSVHLKKTKSGQLFVYFVVLIVSYRLVYGLIQTLEKLNAPHTYDRIDDSNPKILFSNATPEILSRYGLPTKDEPFSKFECATKTCTIASKQGYFDIDDFDAILFTEDTPLPKLRYSHQKYVFTSMKPPGEKSTLPINYDITMTYRMDSDVYIPPFNFIDVYDNVVLPSSKPALKLPDLNHLQDMYSIFKRKSKLVAWLKRNETESNTFVRKLRQYIAVDEYKSEDSLCERLKGDYYFYLSFEDSVCGDYVSEKVAKALLCETVPIINTGAELDRFLPVGSYIDGGKLAPGELADRLQHIVKNSEEYLKYFWWRRLYTVREQLVGVESPLCHLCLMLHDQHQLSTKERNFGDWWHGPLTNPICRQYRS